MARSQNRQMPQFLRWTWLSRIIYMTMIYKLDVKRVASKEMPSAVGELKYRKRSMTCACERWHWTPGRLSSWLWSCVCWHWDICRSQNKKSWIINWQVNMTWLIWSHFSVNAKSMNSSNGSLKCKWCLWSPCFLPGSFHLAPEQQSIFGWFLLFVVLRLHTDVLDLQAKTHFDFKTNWTLNNQCFCDNSGNNWNVAVVLLFFADYTSAFFLHFN